MSRGILVGRIRRLVCIGASLCAVSAFGLASAPAEAGIQDRHPAPQAGRYVAMGDSFASGEGVGPYEPSSNTATDQCHRSLAGSYPAILQRRNLHAFDGLTSVACSGAVTASLFKDLPSGDASSEPGQLKALKRSTKTVTVTIGGNDLGFSAVFAACVYSPVPGVVPGQPGCQLGLNPGVSAAIERLAGHPSPTADPAIVPFRRILSRIHARSPHARIYLTGYPKLFGTTFASPAGCQVGQLGPAPLFVSPADALWIRAKTADLNRAIRSSVARARRSGINARYVNAARAFRTHGLCDTATPWVNGVVLEQLPAPHVGVSSFHPNAPGYVAYADAFGRGSRPAEPKS